MLHELDKDLVRCESTLSNIEQRYGNLARAAANARYVYDQAWADAILNIHDDYLKQDKKLPTVAVMDATATVMVKEQMQAVRHAEADLDAIKKLLDTTQSILTSIQTRAKLAQIEAGLTSTRV